MQLIHKIIFRLRVETKMVSNARKLWWAAQGASFGPGTVISRLNITWPHQMTVGKLCLFEDDIFFKYSSYWKPGRSIIIHDRVFIGRGCEFNITQKIEIGNDSMISSGCKFIDHDHGTVLSDRPMGALPPHEAPIKLENDVWLGVNVVVLKGVTISQGAVVGAGAVVTKSILPHEIWAGIPARKIGERATEKDDGSMIAGVSKS